MKCCHNSYNTLIPHVSLPMHIWKYNIFSPSSNPFFKTLFSRAHILNIYKTVRSQKFKYVLHLKTLKELEAICMKHFICYWKRQLCDCRLRTRQPFLTVKKNCIANLITYFAINRGVFSESGIARTM